jgi:nucleotide-binding universal stress UspA family protein
MIQHILIPTDFSDTADAAAEYGCELAARLGARVTLLNAYSADIIATPDAVFAPTEEERIALRRAALAHLESTAAKLERPGLAIHCTALEGMPGDTILGYAEREHADLVVMGTHGRRGVSRLLLGSVAEHLVRLAPCPVLTVGRHTDVAQHPVAL